MLDVASLWFDILFNGRLSFRRYGGDEILLCIGGIFYQVRTRANDTY